MHLYYSTTVMFSLFSFSLDIGNDVYCILLPAAACNYRPRASVIGAPEQDQKFISINYLTVVQGTQELNFVKIVSGRLSYTLSNWSRCVILPVNSKSRQIASHCVIWRKEGWPVFAHMWPAERKPGTSRKYWIRVIGDFIRTGRFSAKLRLLHQGVTGVLHCIILDYEARLCYYKDAISLNSQGAH